MIGFDEAGEGARLNAEELPPFSDFSRVPLRKAARESLLLLAGVR